MREWTLGFFQITPGCGPCLQGPEMPTQRKKMTPHIPWLKPSTKVTIYNEGVGSVCVCVGGTKRNGARVSAPLGGGHAPGPNFERDIARQR